MKVVLIYLNGEQSLHDLTECGIYSGGSFRGIVGKLNPLYLYPLAVVVDVGHKQGAKCIFTLKAGESYAHETGNLPVYREVPWVMAGDG